MINFEEWWKTTLLNPKIKVSKVQNLVPKVLIPGSKSVVFLLILPLWNWFLHFLEINMIMELLEPDSTLLEGFFWHFQYLNLWFWKFNLALSISDFAILKTKLDTSIAIPQLNIEKSKEFICGKHNLIVLFKKLCPYFLQLASHCSHHSSITSKDTIDLTRMCQRHRAKYKFLL